MTVCENRENTRERVYMCACVSLSLSFLQVCARFNQTPHSLTMIMARRVVDIRFPVRSLSIRCGCFGQRNGTFSNPKARRFRGGI